MITAATPSTTHYIVGQIGWPYKVHSLTHNFQLAAVNQRTLVSWAARDVRFGSKADIRACSGDVRFTPESGHWDSGMKCPLCAKSRHTEAPRGHPLDDCDVHSVQWVTSSSFCLSSEAFR